MSDLDSPHIDLLRLNLLLLDCLRLRHLLFRHLLFRFLYVTNKHKVVIVIKLRFRIETNPFFVIVFVVRKSTGDMARWWTIYWAVAKLDGLIGRKRDTIVRSGDSTSKVLLLSQFELPCLTLSVHQDVLTILFIARACGTWS